VKDDQAREEGADSPAPLSESELSRVPCSAQWQPSRQTSLLLSQLQDVLWSNPRHADVGVEDASFAGGNRAVDRDAASELAGGRRDHRAQIRDDQPLAQAGSTSCSGPHRGAGERSASEPA
jgi:hypothetical protein